MESNNNDLCTHGAGDGKCMECWFKKQPASARAYHFLVRNMEHAVTEIEQQSVAVTFIHALADITDKAEREEVLGLLDSTDLENLKKAIPVVNEVSDIDDKIDGALLQELDDYIFLRYFAGEASILYA